MSDKTIIYTVAILLNLTFARMCGVVHDLSTIALYVLSAVSLTAGVMLLEIEEPT